MMCLTLCLMIVVADKSQNDQQAQLQAEEDHESECLDASRKVVAEEVPGSNKQRDSLCQRTSAMNGEESGSPKTVPPLRLKKISKLRVESSWAARTTQTPEPDADKDSGEAVHVESDELASFGKLASEKAGDGGAVKSIEIMIPSMPELGIKETRTDRISLPRETMPSKSFIINYILEKER
jgi:hypothetical protein